MTNDSRLALVGRWFDLIASGATERWGEVADDQLTMKTPFSPPGLPTEMSGLAACQQGAAQLWQAFKSFEWGELEIFETVHADYFFATARSRAETLWGATYANDYCFKIKLHNGKIIEQTEYFNPAPVIEVFKDHLGPAA